ncbi:30S ribosomal protein S8 [Candidatus Beckwithbacteria bacterium CG2_30_44_31]|uniref:Small ribosomal subunit protein uS8 n=1 Tax=Candidatus Beckwithbacteria bacterium CG2_30_44_31 TaxID=1805035 RepID=A0A1J5AWM5_9BACT|nr:MAG: 30S ribosomal protein S8 [Candidatus Beckwithbacteria bacterium CG2_30_44_31]
MTDPLADLLIRIKNAQSSKHKTTLVPYSRLKESLVKILITNNYLTDYQVEGNQAAEKNLNLTLKYVRKQPAVAQIKRISKPGVRHYVNQFNIKKLTIGRGLVIISTSQGMMTAKEARKQRLGGEIICKIN